MSELHHNQPHVPNERPSGVPPPHRLGDARKEMWWLVLGLIVLTAIIVAFVFESLG